VQQSNQSIIPQYGLSYMEIADYKACSSDVGGVSYIIEFRLDWLLLIEVFGAVLFVDFVMSTMRLSVFIYDCEWVRSVWFASHVGVNFSCNNSSVKSFSNWLMKGPMRVKWCYPFIMKSGGLEIRDVLRELKFLVHLIVIKVLSKRFLTVYKMICCNRRTSPIPVSNIR